MAGFSLTELVSVCGAHIARHKDSSEDLGGGLPREGDDPSARSTPWNHQFEIIRESAALPE
jgi:hypothetical protein